MTRLDRTFAGLRERGHAAFVPFLVIGDPTPDDTVALTDALVAADADVLEFGFAFSDPPADGPVIQAADVRALEGGITPTRSFEVLAEVRRRHPEVPISLLLYYNLILRAGVDRFYARCAEVGVDAVLVADVPLEESDDAVTAARTHGIAPVFIGSELSTDQRLAKVAEVADGFLYAVARIGTTGERTDVAADIDASLARFRRYVPLPILVGFGISGPEQARQVIDAGADGVIVGSAIVRRIAAHLDDRAEMIHAVTAFASTMAEACHR